MLQMFRFSRLLFWLGGAGILILSTMAVIFFVMPPIRDTGDIVYLQANETPFKVRPSDEGGQKIAHQNSRFMSYLDKEKAETEEKEILHLNEDLPEPPPVPIDAEKPIDTTPAQAGAQGLAASDTKNPEKQSVMATPLAQEQTEIRRLQPISRTVQIAHRPLMGRQKIKQALPCR